MVLRLRQDTITPELYLPELLLLTDFSFTSTVIRTWISNFIHVKPGIIITGHGDSFIPFQHAFLTQKKFILQ